MACPCGCAAKVSARISDAHRSGAAACMAIATTPPSERPQMCASSMPRAVHRGEDRGRIIVARGAFAELAFAVAGIVEGERPCASARNAPAAVSHTDLSEPTPCRKIRGVRSPPPASTVPTFPSAVSMLAMPST